MNFTTERGNITLGFVLLLFALGILMLSGLRQQLSHQRHLVSSEVSFLKQYAAALSAQAWGSQQQWAVQQHWQCQQQPEKGWRACLLITVNNEAVLASQGIDVGERSPLTLWHWGIWEDSHWLPTPHGWLDFCPFAQTAQCKLPQ